MTKIFLSYSRKDKARAERIVHALETSGHTIWWDEHLIPGEPFRSTIRQQLDTVDYVVVLWSQSSAASAWVQEEASLAHGRNMLIPILLEQVEPPMPFGRLQNADLRKWDGDTTDQHYRSLLQALEKKADIKPPPTADTNNLPQPANEEKNAVLSDLQGWFTTHKKLSVVAIIGVLFSGFMLLGEITGNISNIEQFWNRLHETPQLQLSYTSNGQVNPGDRIHLTYIATDNGFLSLWNQSAVGVSELILPTQGMQPLQLNPSISSGNIGLKTLNETGTDRLILLWTPEGKPRHLPHRYYATRAEFEAALQAFEASKSAMKTEIEIPIYPAE